MGKLIDSDKLKAELDQCILYDCDDKLIFYDVIEQQPEAIVRCNDCKYADHTVVYGRFMCNRHDFPVKVDSGMFCADGKKES